MKFSIIIPVYNMERYIKRCIDSVLKQNVSINEFEVIAIDDGSTDNSPYILDEYSSNYPQVRVIHQENSGIGEAYRNGLSVASGEYICFVDSDDYVEESLLQDLSETIEQYNHPCVIQFGLLFEDEAQNEFRRDYPKASVIKDNQKILEEHFERFQTPSLACRVFRRGLFDGIVFIDQNIGIDEILIVQLLLKASTIISLEKCYYHVFVREASVSRNVLTGVRLKQFENVYEVLTSVTRNTNSYAYYNILIKKLKLIQELYFDEGMKKQDRIKLMTEFKEAYSIVKGTEVYQKQNRVYRSGVNIFIRNPFLYKLLRKTK